MNSFLSSPVSLSRALRLHWTILIVSGFCLVLCTACRKEEGVQTVATFKPNTGQIQILNGSGKSGVADAFRDYLISLGFDVIEFGNAREWNYEHTLVISRVASDTIARDMAKALGTTRVLHLQRTTSLMEATVIIGKDYEELMRTWQHPKENPAKQL